MSYLIFPVLTRPDGHMVEVKATVPGTGEAQSRIDNSFVSCAAMTFSAKGVQGKEMSK